MANHTYSHEPLSRASDGDVIGQIQGGVGATTIPRLLRPPFAAGALTTRLEALAYSQGYSLCRWTVDTFDWDAPRIEEMVERITYGDYRSPPIHAGGNILMHGAGRNTASGLQRIIDAIRSKGLALDPLRQHGTAIGGAAPR